MLDRFGQGSWKKMLAVAAAGGIAFGGMRRGSERAPEEEPTEQAGDKQGMRRIIFDELLDRGEVGFEYESRHGKASWTPEQAADYNQIRTLSGKFEYLHQNNRDLMATYKSPQGRMENFAAIFDLMETEFSHSSLPFQFAQEVVEDAPGVLAKMDEREALKLYKTVADSLAKKVGVRYVRELAQGIQQTMGAQHAVVKQVEADGWLSEEVAQWFTKRADNAVLFDQMAGRVEVYHERDGRRVLLEAFPGNGGPSSDVAWKPGLPGHVSTRTPDGTFSFDRVLEKKSPSWQNSWVGDTAPLRWADEAHTQVDYQDQDGKWRRLTGSDAEFVVYGAPQKPFRQMRGSHLYREASRLMADGTKMPPQEFFIEDALDAQGNLRATWDRNDFGPKSIRMKDPRGELMSVFFHSSPEDESPEVFLDYSHGCIHMKPGDIDRMGETLARGAEIRISSIDEMELVVAAE